MSGFDAACAVLPPELRRAACALPEDIKTHAQEFRLRLGQPAGCMLPEREYPIGRAKPVSREDLARLLELATNASPYTAAAAIREGYVSAPGGVRVGLCGRMRRGAEESWARSGLTSAAVRIPREVKGCAERFCRSEAVSTLILSPPGAGKTTLLRDMVRLWSDRGYRVALCDERSEVSAPSPEGFGFDVGARTDVLTDAPKHTAALQLLRTMNPEILAMDEITDPRDAEACRRASGCGVTILATAHGEAIADERSAAPWRALVREGVFQRCIRIRRTARGREYTEERI